MTQKATQGDLDEITAWAASAMDLPVPFQNNPVFKKTRFRLHQVLGGAIWHERLLQSLAEYERLLLFEGFDSPWINTQEDYDGVEYFIRAAYWCSYTYLAQRYIYGIPEPGIIKQYGIKYKIKRNPPEAFGKIEGSLKRRLELQEIVRQNQLPIHVVIASGGGSEYNNGTFEERDIDFLTFSDEVTIRGTIMPPHRYDQSKPETRTSTEEMSMPLDRPTDSDPVWEEITAKRLVSEKYPEMDISEEELRLFESYRDSMIWDASGSNEIPPLGHFVILKKDVPLISEIDFHELRLVVKQNGLWLSINYPDGNYFFGWWSPTWDNFAVNGTPREHVVVFQLIAACLWRDLKVVNEKTFERTYTYRRKDLPRVNKQTKKTLHLPRTIYRVTWGSEEEKSNIQNAIDQIAERRAHEVRPHFRQLPEGYKPSDEARRNALNYGYPEPPDGWTFVEPHMRGAGETDNLKREPIRVMSKGLHAATMLMNKLIHIKQQTD